MAVDKDKEKTESAKADASTSTTTKSSTSQLNELPKRTSDGIEIVDISDDPSDMDDHFTLDEIMDDEDAELLRYAEMHAEAYADDFDDHPFDEQLPAEPDYIHDGRSINPPIPASAPSKAASPISTSEATNSQSPTLDISAAQGAESLASRSKNSVGDHLFLDLKGGLWTDAASSKEGKAQASTVENLNNSTTARSAYGSVAGQAAIDTATTLPPFGAATTPPPLSAPAQFRQSRAANNSSMNQGRYASESTFSDSNDSTISSKYLAAGEISLSSLKNIRNLRAWFKDATASDINDILILFEKLKAEKEQAELEKKRKEEAHRAFVRMYRDDGTNEASISFIDPQALIDGLVDRLGCGNYQYNKTKVKYRFVDLHGKICEWTGQGREPKRLKDIMEATGKPREAFLYQPELQGYNEVDPDEIQYISQLVAHETQAKKYDEYVKVHAPHVQDVDKQHITFGHPPKRPSSKRKSKSAYIQDDTDLFSDTHSPSTDINLVIDTAD